MLNITRLKTPISLIIKEVKLKHWLRTINTGNLSLCKVDEDRNAVKYRKKFPIEVCLEYMESQAYEKTYGDKPVWHVYIRNFRGGIPPDTRHTCMTAKGRIITGSPCPICRDEYLLPHYLNVKLLKQFISPYGGDILGTKKTGVCQIQHFNLKVAIKKAQNFGLLTFPVPHRAYDYSLYYKKQ